MKPDIASATEKHFAPFSYGKMSSKRGIGCLGTLITLLMVFDGSKQILNLSFVSLIVMLLHQAVGSYCRQIFPSLSILSNCSLILACLATGCRWMASCTGVTFRSKSKETGFPNRPTLYAHQEMLLEPTQELSWPDRVAMMCLDADHRTSVVQVSGLKV